jgi:hypothetical protein
MSIANPQFNSWRMTTLMNLLVTNPKSISFPIGINGGAIASGSAATQYQDVTRQQILNEIANRVADQKAAGIAPTQVIIDFANPVGANDPQPVPGTPNYVLTASQVK